MSTTIMEKSEDIIEYIYDKIRNSYTNGYDIFSNIKVKLFTIPLYKNTPKSTGNIDYCIDIVKKTNIFVENTLNIYPLYKNPEPKLNGLELEKWEIKAKDLWLTVGTIGILKPGSIIKLLVMDRNMYDILLNSNKPNTLYTSKEFFRFNTATYIHKKGLQGTLIFHHDDGDVVIPSFEFHVHCDTFCWYPLKNGILPAEDDEGLGKLYGYEITSEELPLNTNIGWRGPMILWKNVEKMPDIYWYKP